MAILQLDLALKAMVVGLGIKIDAQIGVQAGQFVALEQRQTIAVSIATIVDNGAVYPEPQPEVGVKDPLTVELREVADRIDTGIVVVVGAITAKEPDHHLAQRLTHVVELF